jgi:integrase
MRRVFTARFVEKIKPPVEGRVEFYDAALPSFGLRVTQRGSKSWFLFYRIHGRLKRLTIGRYPVFLLAEARDAAREALRKVAKGIDPAHEKAEREDAAKDTLQVVLDEFTERYAKRRIRTWAERRRLIEKDFAHLLDRPVHSITRRDIRDTIDRVVDRGSPVMANRLLAYTATMFNWAVEREIIDESPAKGIKKPAVERPRDRVLTDREIALFWKSGEQLGFPFGPLFLLLLVTGQRRGEVAAMTWQDLDLENCIWRMPREATKSDRSHDVPLSDLALSILKSVPRFSDNGLVFPGRGRTKASLSGWSRAKRRLDAVILAHLRKEVEKRGEDPEAAIPPAPWTLHDLRRTTASGMASLQVPPQTLAAVLNHSPGRVQGITAVYNRYGYENEKKSALEIWADRLREIVEGRRRENVVPMRPGG